MVPAMVQAGLWRRHLRPEVSAEDASCHGHPCAHRDEGLPAPAPAVPRPYLPCPDPLPELLPSCHWATGIWPHSRAGEGWAGVSLTCWMPWHPVTALRSHALSLCVLSPAGPEPGEARSAPSTANRPPPPRWSPGRHGTGGSRGDAGAPQGGGEEQALQPVPAVGVPRVGPRGGVPRGGPQGRLRGAGAGRGDPALHSQSLQQRLGWAGLGWRGRREGRERRKRGGGRRLWPHMHPQQRIPPPAPRLAPRSPGARSPLRSAPLPAAAAAAGRGAAPPAAPRLPSAGYRGFRGCHPLRARLPGRSAGCPGRGAAEGCRGRPRARRGGAAAAAAPGKSRCGRRGGRGGGAQLLRPSRRAANFAAASAGLRLALPAGEGGLGPVPRRPGTAGCGQGSPPPRG